MATTPARSSRRSWIEFLSDGKRSAQEILASLPREERSRILGLLSPEDLEALRYDWAYKGRPSQQTPSGAWRIWLVCTGRGWGKSVTGANQVIAWARDHPGCRIHLVARTAADYRDVMVRCILEQSQPWFMPTWEPSNRKVKWPNGSEALCFSAEEAAQLRGPECQFGWLDEAAQYADLDDVWKTFKLGWRVGPSQKCVITTTPKTKPLIVEWLRAGGVLPDADGSTREPDPSIVVTTGTMFENWSHLTPEHLDDAEAYRGTAFYRQEVQGIPPLEDPAALWRQARIDELRVDELPDDALIAIYVGVDPSGSSETEMGIVAVAAVASSDHYYVLCDASTKGMPAQRYDALLDLMEILGNNPRPLIIAEANFGGDTVPSAIETAARARGMEPPRVVVRHAMKSKRIRAEPIALLYQIEPGRVHHVGVFAALESELVTFAGRPGERSPNRLDALVWAIDSLEEMPRYGKGRRPYAIT